MKNFLEGGGLDVYRRSIFRGEDSGLLEIAIINFTL